MKKGRKSKYLYEEKDTSSALKDVIEGNVMTGSGSANNDIVAAGIIAVKIKSDEESYSEITGEKGAAADEDGVDNGMPFVANINVKIVDTLAGTIFKKYVLPS
jgi:hypothetical protein